MKLQPWQHSTIIGCLGVLGIGTILIFTNPHRNAYQTYAAQQASFYLQENACTKTPQFLGNFLQKQCNQVVNMSQPYLKSLVNLSTRQHNYVLFSIYETEFSLGKNFPSYNAKTIAFLNLFWTYESGLELTQQ